MFHHTHIHRHSSWWAIDVVFLARERKFMGSFRSERMMNRTSLQSDWNRRHMERRECRRRLVADGADGWNRSCLARKSIHIDVNSSIQCVRDECHFFCLDECVCVFDVSTYQDVIELERRRRMMRIVTPLIFFSLELQIGETKRTRTSYSRYQTLELEKEFHFNRWESIGKSKEHHSSVLF